MTFALRYGARYRAVIQLGFFEAMAKNSTIEEKLRAAGFADVTVGGNGSTRIAHGRWTGLDTITELPRQIKSAVEVT